MEDWVLWMIGAGALIVGEIFTLSFFMGPLGLAAIVAGVAALLGASVPVQLLVFAVTSAITVLGLRPVARRHLITPTRLQSGTAALVGQQATVLERVDRHSGQVKLRGEVWTARSFGDDEVIEPGAPVHVMEIEGARAVVSEAGD